MNNFLNNKANTYFLLWSLYELKGTLYEEGTLINQVLLLIILLMTFFEAYSCLQIRKQPEISSLFKSISALIIMFTLYGIVLFITDGAMVKGKLSQYYIEGAYISLLPIYVMYLYTKNGLITIRSLQFWMVVFLIVGICEYFKMERGMIARLLVSNSMFDEFTNNAGNWLLYLMPGMLVFRKKPLYLYIGVAVCTIFIIMSMKRGAILICLLLLFMIIRSTVKKASRKQTYSVVILAMLSLSVLVNFVKNKMLNSDYFNYRIEQTLEGNSSNRDVLYEDFWNIYTDQSTIIEKLVGKGAWATFKIENSFAHNDWLELLINNGLLGAILLFVFLYRFFLVVRCKALSDESRFCLLLIFLIVLIRTFLSMSICSLTIYATSIFGFSLADGFRQDKKELHT